MNPDEDAESLGLFEIHRKMESNCYCGTAEPEQKPYMLICGGCKKYFHSGCLQTGKISPLEGDIFYQFKCKDCGEEGKEEFERMKMQWLQVVMLTLYNLQLSGNGKCGYFRWKEHICAFIDKYWTHLFSTHRKKTSLWHGTVAGTLSTGCPGYFTSGGNVLGESGWWKLTEMKPPVLRVDSGPRSARKKMDPMPGIDPSAVIKVEGLRSRHGRSSIEAAIALKVKRSTLTEAKEMRKARAVSKTPDATPTKSSISGVARCTPTESGEASDAACSTLPEVKNFELFHPQGKDSSTSGTAKTKTYDTVSKGRIISDGSTSKGKRTCVKQEPHDESFLNVTKTKTCETGSKGRTSSDGSASKVRKTSSVKQELMDESSSRSDDHSLSISLKQEVMDSENSITSAWSHRADLDSDSQFSLSSSHMWFTDKDTKPSATMPELFLHNDSDSDLEIDPCTMSPPAGMSSATFRESPSVQDILSSIDDNSHLSEDSLMTSSGSKPNVSDVKLESMTPADSENEADCEEESETSDAEEEVSHKKRKTEEEEDKKEEEPPPPKYSLLSVYDEYQLLRKLNMAADKTTLDHAMNRLRRKLIVRQLKRERGMAVFDLDIEMQKHVSPISGDLKNPEENCGHYSSITPHTKYNRGDLRILDRFQCNRFGSQRSSQQFPSFLNRLVGTEDDQLQSITSPYTTRVLKPFIRRDRESKPLKMRLLEEIIAYPHRNDKSWKPPPSHPIDYCYVRPQHIPSVNILCREFFWPGIDLSECLQYPDFSCVVLYRKVVIGFAFMVPDVKYNEAYISFIFTHPEWRQAGIATFMLYHLIQTCMGKDVTLHVSATNTAMLLYQKFGFKVEEMILDFYDKYYPVDSRQCKHAFFLRLRR